MIATYPVFFLHETPLFQVAFRRHEDPSWDGECSGPFGYHAARVVLAEMELPEDRQSNRAMTEEELRDPLCPVECDWCTFRFSEKAISHYDVWHLYRSNRDGKLFTLHGSPIHESAAPPGAMWDANWWPSERSPRSPDGMFLVLRTPAGDWHIDGKASNGPGWTRTGDPKEYPCSISATPSIGFGGSSEHFHGWLRNGVLEQDGGTARWP